MENLRMLGTVMSGREVNYGVNHTDWIFLERTKEGGIEKKKNIQTYDMFWASHTCSLTFHMSTYVHVYMYVASTSVNKQYITLVHMLLNGEHEQEVCGSPADNYFHI